MIVTKQVKLSKHDLIVYRQPFSLNCYELLTLLTGQPWFGGVWMVTLDASTLEHQHHCGTLTMNSDDEYTALVTGFGPFDNHVINASWEAVKELSNLSATSEQLKDVKVIVKEIPVSYDGVVDHVSKLCDEYKPTVILHVGVSKVARCLTVECCARSNGYKRPDIHNKCPDENDVAEKILKSGINVNKVCDIVNNRSRETNCKACVSYDAGRYLCEYTFYKSMEIDPMKTLFVHVPDFDKYSSVQTAKGLHDILCYLIESARN